MDYSSSSLFAFLDLHCYLFITQSIMLIYLCVLAETKLGSVMINCLGHLQCLGHLHQSQQEKDYAKVALLLHKRDKKREADNLQSHIFLNLCLLLHFNVFQSQLLMTSWATTKSSLLNDSITRV
ncbi:uncharacterized protein LOC131620300 isoform X7 [Vicia villosa]|uniref:uncharacterized protein LOC131608910 isoform X3 n=1 Tax=Vicia villosa TaxID=3911 RepID=UPI00273C9651|nr:uncharacterized protein LOC131608910 isoform X3 [Vicia villosa]XP_058747312.1 uncharacterized protein LOC131620300 isoform X7 [Vicia villosa]